MTRTRLSRQLERTKGEIEAGSEWIVVRRLLAKRLKAKAIRADEIAAGARLRVVPTIGLPPAICADSPMRVRFSLEGEDWWAYAHHFRKACKPDPGDQAQGLPRGDDAT